MMVIFYHVLFFQVGDRIVSINGQPLDGLTHTDVVNVLKNAYGRIILQVLGPRACSCGRQISGCGKD